MEMNKIIQQLVKNKNIYNINQKPKGALLLKPLENCIPEGLSRKTCIHIAGDEEVGKTSLALEFAYRNPNNIFIYIDTYFKLQEVNVPDNVYLFRTNSIEEIINYLNKLENKAADYLIIDSISNLLLPIEQTRDLGYVSLRYNEFNNAMIKIIEKCCNLNICLMLLNTINGKGVPSYFSSQLKYRCSFNILIEDKVKEEKYYRVNIKVGKFNTDINQYDIKSLLLTGKGDD